MAGKNTIKKSALAPTVLIAGGAGFIGSHLVEALLEKDARVVVLDNFNTGKQNYVEKFLNSKKFALYNVDINQGLPEEIESVDYIFHLASLEEYQYQKETANLDSLLTNALGTKNLLDLAQHSSAKFLLTSSIDVYKGQISPLNLDQYYGQTEEEERKYKLVEAKRFAEALVREYFNKYDVNARIVRLPEIYGPHMNLEASGTLGRLVHELTHHKDLTLYGEGTEKEYYLYIDDAISGLVKSLFTKRTKGKIYTLVEKEPHTPLELSFLLRNLANERVQITYNRIARPPQKRSVIPDTSNLSDIKWRPKTKIKNGIIKTLESVGYKINEHTFKPNKLIEQKKTELKKSREKKDVITSLQTVIPKEKEKPPKNLRRKKLKKPSITKVAVSLASPATIKKRVKMPVNFPKSPLLIGGVLTLAFLLVFVTLPIAQTYIHTKKAVTNLEKIPTTLAQLQTEEARKTANNAFQNFYKAQYSFMRLNWIFKLTGKEQHFDSGTKLLESASYFSEAIYNTSKAVSPFNNIWDVIKPDSEEQFTEEQFVALKANLEKAKTALQFAQTKFKYIDKNSLIGPFKEPVETYADVLDQTADGLDTAITAVTDISNLMGIDSPRKFLILFQNSNELRPTGGFIGSYAVLELDKGKISDLIIDDVYNPDGQLDIRNISVAPPTPIATFLKEDKLHIRNANWDPDFEKSAKTIEDLFFKINGEHFDGILAIDLKVVLELLNITGPVFLTAYNEEVTAENLYEKAQFYSEFNYEEGSDQKRSFLTLLGSKVLEKIFALPRKKMPESLTTVNSLLEGKHILIYIPNNPINVVLNEKGWDGSLKNTNADYLYVVNANLGGTKANYFVKNDLRYKVSSDTRDGLLRGTLTMTYTHTGKDSAWPGGPYTDYVRVLTQRGSRLTGAEVTTYPTTEKAKAEKRDVFKEIIVGQEKNYTSFETSFVLQPQETIELTITYDLPTQLALTKDKKNYELFWQKQPGTHDDTATFAFQPPFGLEIGESTPNMTIKKEAIFETTLNTDQEISILLK